MPNQHSPSNRCRRWRSWCVRGAAALLALGVSVTLVEAQSLAEVARREAERRKAIKTTPKVYTNKDLGSASYRPPTPVSAPDPATAAQTPPAEARTPPEEVKDEKYWRQRITQARENLARAEILRAALESRINALQTDFVNRDDPAQQAVIAQDRQKAMNEMTRTTADIERLKKEITDIQEEARKAGAPPGWVR